MDDCIDERMTINRFVWESAGFSIPFCQLSLVVSPDLLVVRHLPPTCAQRKVCFVVSMLAMHFRKQESTTIPTTLMGMSAERSGVHFFRPLGIAHSAALHQCRECFSSTPASESPGWILPRGLKATSPFSPRHPSPLDDHCYLTLFQNLLLLPAFGNQVGLDSDSH